MSATAQCRNHSNSVTWTKTSGFASTSQTGNTVYFKMRKFLTTISILLMFCFLGMAQESSNSSNWSIQITQGVGLPIGKFKKATGPEAFWVEREGGGQFLKGFPKKGNGFARSGYQLELTLRKQIKQRMWLNIVGSVQKNALYEGTMEDAYNYIYQDGTRLSIQHTPYRSINIIPSVEYLISKGGLDLSLLFGYGVSKLDYPNYVFEYPFNPGVYFGHTVKLDDVWSSSLYMGCSIQYRLFNDISIMSKISLISSDFEYDNFTGSFPAGSNPYEFKDEVNLRSLNVGLGFTYSFGRD